MSAELTASARVLYATGFSARHAGELPDSGTRVSRKLLEARKLRN